MDYIRIDQYPTLPCHPILHQSNLQLPSAVEFDYLEHASYAYPETVNPTALVLIKAVNPEPCSLC